MSPNSPDMDVFFCVQSIILVIFSGSIYFQMHLCVL